MMPAAPTFAAFTSGHPLIAAGAAFFAVFGLFVVAFGVLVVITVRWAVRRDRVGRAEWVQRQKAAAAAVPPQGREPRTNGHVPRRKDRHGGSPRKPR